MSTTLAAWGSLWTRYQIAVAITAARRRGPFRFGRFLDWAEGAGLLRVSGVSYQFRHREMQDRLIATRSDDAHALLEQAGHIADSHTSQ